MFKVCYNTPTVKKLASSSVAPPFDSPLGLMGDVMELVKFRLTALVVLTALTGFLLAPETISTLHSFFSLSGITLLVAGCCALNCYLERDIDKKMQRTCTRPLPAGRLSAGWVLNFSISLILASLCLLSFAAGPLTALLGILAGLLYLYAYTPLKQRSIYSLFIGAVPGALPPVLGWTAVMQSLDAMPVILFAIIFSWQIPHFMAIGLYREEDYQRAGFKIISLEYGHGATRWQIVLWGSFLLLVSLLPFPLGLLGKNYFYCALGLGGSLSLYALWGAVFCGEGRSDGKRWARRYFWATLVYLSLLFAALLGC